MCKNPDNTVSPLLDMLMNRWRWSCGDLLLRTRWWFAKCVRFILPIRLVFMCAYLIFIKICPIPELSWLWLFFSIYMHRNFYIRIYLYLVFSATRQASFVVSYVRFDLSECAQSWRAGAVFLRQQRELVDLCGALSPVVLV